MKGAINPLRFAEQLAQNNSMLNLAQATIDDGLELAALVIAEADGRSIANPERKVAVARGMLASKTELASYLTEDAIREGQPTRGALLRYMSGWYD